MKRLVLPVLLLMQAVGAAGQDCRRGDGGAVIRGVVVDQETRVPLQGATVEIAWGRDGERRFDTESDAGGRFRLCRVPTGDLVDLRAHFWTRGPMQRVQPVANDSIEVELEVAAPHSVLRGVVKQEAGGAPLSEAVVRVLGTPFSALTDERGEFQVPRLPPGRYAVQIEHLGYGVRTDTVPIDFRSTVELTAALAVQPIALAPLIVSTRSHILTDVGFYERQQLGDGRFMTKDMWREQSPLQPSDILRLVAGIKVQEGRTMMDNVVYDRNNCPMRYFMDGARLNPTFQIDQIDVSWIEALEIYRGPSEVPGQFRGFSSSERGNCGVIVIWTRSGR